MPELNPDMSWDDYRAVEALNPSLLKVGQKSMKHLKYARDNPQPPKDAFVFGHAVHTVVFEHHELDNRFIVFDGRRDKRMPAYQDVLIQAEETGCEILKSAELKAAVEMGLAVATDPLVKPIIAAGKAEVSVFSEEYGQPTKGRLDWVCSSPGFADLKTCRDIRPFAFCSDCFRYSYDISLGLYQRWLSQIRGQEEPCSIIAVEKTPPYDCVVYDIPQAVLDRGAERGLAIIEKYIECEKSGEWPGVADRRPGEFHVPYREMDEPDQEPEVKFDD